MKKIFLPILVLMVFFSCKEDDTSETNSLQGRWNLINVTCECPPVDFQIGEHVWTFNVVDNNVRVVNNPDEDLQILETGNYDFSLTDNTITILSVPYDYFFEGETLFITDQPEVDGPALEFVRN
ncbi:hypothetical protein POV27_05135 [Aureisphaera galaxeae]|uniref:hypothetical protein n=1 Tax=Aureisphaera galaxeae TaxID=1538023 RepID=UPI00234FF170|nr:hypothetical protein [Aureisphaera galaxeae]MDC8003423.1 hypothetical protein [Aureisphaera galaxeae]